MPAQSGFRLGDLFLASPDPGFGALHFLLIASKFRVEFNQFLLGATLAFEQSSLVVGRNAKHLVEFLFLPFAWFHSHSFDVTGEF